jgi:hypothetical protein
MTEKSVCIYKGSYKDIRYYNDVSDEELLRLLEGSL